MRIGKSLAGLSKHAPQQTIKLSCKLLEQFTLHDTIDRKCVKQADSVNDVTSKSADTAACSKHKGLLTLSATRQA